MTGFIEIVGAIALLLWGLRMVRTGVMRAFGTWLKRLASHTEGKILPSFTSGVVAAALLQSSTATAMIASSFSGRRVVSVRTAFLTILGADVGTALAVQIASQRITFIAPLLIAAGVFGHLSATSNRTKNICRAGIGLGLILLGLTMLSTTAAGLSDAEDFNTLLQLLSSHPIFLLVCAVIFTYIAHSSLAIVLLVAGFAATGLIDLQSAVFLVLGANVGSALLPVIANWSSSSDARIPVTANLLVRSLSVAAVFPLTGLILTNSPISVEPQFFIPIYHLVLNLIVAVIGVIIASPLLMLCRAMLPGKHTDELLDPKYLADIKQQSPGSALACATREALHMGDIVRMMLGDVLPVLQGNNYNLLKRIEHTDDAVDRIFEEIKYYIASLLQQELTMEESEKALDVLSFTANLEHIGDIVERNLMQLAAKKIELQAQFSEEGMQEITKLHEAVVANFDLAINVFMSDDPDLANLLLDAKYDVRALERESVSTHLSRIGIGEPDTMETSSLHLDVLRDLKRINSHLSSAAYPVLRRAGETPKTKRKRKPPPPARAQP